MDDFFKPVSNKKSITPGTIIRRVGSSKDQQGSFLKFDENWNMILANIIDMSNGTLVASEAVLKPQSSDKIYYYESSFNDSPVAAKALKIIKNWPFLKEHGELKDRIINFISISYTPEQIIDMSEREMLHLLFVPVQQKFRLGRFKEHRIPSRVCNDIFKLWLESMNTGKHMTYLAQVTEQKSHSPMFYSAGAVAHEETAKRLQDEIFKFDPTHGGHIKVIGIENDKKLFVIDAGSKYMGLGVKTPLAVSSMVADALHALYPEFEFTPLEGRGAIE